MLDHTIWSSIEVTEFIVDRCSENELNDLRLDETDRGLAYKDHNNKESEAVFPAFYKK